jgi:hypothetical protein
MALQGFAGAGIGAWSASGHAMVGCAGTGLDIALLAPTAVIQIRPIARNLSLPVLPFTGLTICSAAFAIVTAAVLACAGIVVGALGAISVAEPDIRNELATAIALVGSLSGLSKKLWQTIR